LSATRPVLALDLDGTLVDTAGDLVAALNHVLAGEGVKPFALADAVKMVGNGSRAMLRTALTESGRQPAEAELDGMTADLLAWYMDHIAVFSRPFPGVEQALDRFAAAGWRLAVCTNKFESAARLLLTELGLADRFAAIAGQDTFAAMKPDPLHLTETVRAAGGDPRQAIMVGDTHVDADTARNAGVPSVLVTFGYSAVPPATLGADRLIDHYDQLFDTVAGLIRT
jgi:phosphoglycolate phosphatase